MNKIKYIIQILTVLIFLGCTEDEFTGNKGDIQVVAGFATTRTTFVEDNGTTHVTWDTGDAIGLFTDEQNNLQYTAQSTGSETQFNTTGEKLQAAEGKTVYAYYPYSKSESQQKIKLPNIAVQQYKENTSEQDFIYASGNVVNKKLSLQFKHLFAFLKITIPMELIADRGENGGLYIQSTEEISCDAYFNLGKEEMTSEKYNGIYYYIPTSKELEKKKEIICYIAILPQTKDTELKIYNLSSRNIGDCLLTKKIPLGDFKTGNVYTLYLNENETEVRRQQEKDALIAFYKATNGDNWTRNDNWCSDKPLEEWYGVSCSSEGVSNIYIAQNNLKGTLPAELGNLTNLRELLLFSGNLEGNIPPELGNLTKLSYLSLSYNELIGNIPSELGNLTAADKLDIDLSYNKLTGTIPKSFDNLTNLTSFLINDNYLSGSISETFMHMDIWQYAWPWTLAQNGDGFERSNLILPGPKFSATTSIGKHIDNNIYTQNKYTILFEWREHPSSDAYISGLQTIYNNYKKKGVEVVGYTTYLDNSGISAYVSKHKIAWPMFRYTSENIASEVTMLANPYTPAINIVDTNGNIVIDSHYTSLVNISAQEHQDILAQFFQEKLGNPDPITPEEPTNYSKDGNVTMLQRASEGNGIDIVLMGDIFSDRLIANGTYETTMKKVADYLFTEEPFKTYRRLFNVYMVDVVSKNETYGGETALNTYINAPMAIGDDQKCFEYAQKAITAERMEEALVVVIINYKMMNVGACSMVIPKEKNDYGSGISIAYFSIGDETSIEELVHHEANGHGFAKLADEYAYQNYGTIPTNVIEDYQNVTASHGWYIT